MKFLHLPPGKIDDQVQARPKGRISELKQAKNCSYRILPENFVEYSVYVHIEEDFISSRSDK